MPTSSELRNAAAALDTYQAARSWAEGVRPGTSDYGVRVTWSLGGAINGYKELSDEVSRIVETGMGVFINQAIENLRIKSVEAMKPVQESL